MTFTDLIRKNLNFIIILTLLVSGLVLIVSLFQQPLYKSSLSVMVVQKQTEEVNAQTSVESAEKMADILSRVVDSQAFRVAVLANTDVNVDLPVQPWKEEERWREYVETKNITDTGILVVDIYQPTTSQATKLAASVQEVLTSKGYEYLGADPGNVYLRQLNPPSPTDDSPAKPNLFLNTAVGFLFGIILSLGLLLLFPNTSWGSFAPKVKKFGSSRQPKKRTATNVVTKRAAQPSGGMIFSEKFINQASKDSSHPMTKEYKVDEKGGAHPQTVNEDYDTYKVKHNKMREQAKQGIYRGRKASPPTNLPQAQEEEKGGLVSQATSMLDK